MTRDKNVPGGSVSPKFENFNITDVVYKEVDGVSIPASILVPKDIKPGKTPVTIRWHGGGLAGGHRLFAGWYPAWNISLAADSGAIMISADHRLIPECTGLEVLQDVSDFYTWLFTPGNLTAHLPDGLEPDLDHLLLTGESAGGYLAIQSVFLLRDRPGPSPIAAIIGQYPMLDLRDRWYTEKFDKNIMNIPQLPVELLHAHLSTWPRGKTPVSQILGPGDVPIVVIMLQQGIYTSYVGSDRVLFPLEALADEKSHAGFPPLWIAHGRRDSCVPVTGSQRFVEALHEKYPRTPIHTSYVEDREHGFDLRDPETGEDNGKEAGLDTDWVKRGVEFLKPYWPVGGP